MYGKKSIILTVVTIAVSTFFMCGCGSAGQNRKPPKVSDDMLAPRIISFGNILWWDDVIKATDYEVYRNDVLCDTVKTAMFRLTNVTEDSEYFVVAVDKKTSERTEKSNIVTVSQNNNFTAEQTLDLTGGGSYSGEIPPSVRQVIIGGASRSDFNLSAVLQERANDITFVISNVSITGFIATENFSYKRADNDYNVIFDVTGQCAVKGPTGDDGFDYSEKIYDNKEIDAGSGSNGGSPLVLSSIVVCGSGNLSIVGGNGGNGGIGSSTTKWEAVNGPGAGADGGDGGDAVKCAYLVVDMDSDECNVCISDGVGGAKGKPGTNGSIITGPPATAMWKDMYDIGKAGKNGKSVIGSKKIIRGSVTI